MILWLLQTDLFKHALNQNWNSEWTIMQRNTLTCTDNCIRFQILRSTLKLLTFINLDKNNLVQMSEVQTWLESIQQLPIMKFCSSDHETLFCSKVYISVTVSLSAANPRASAYHFNGVFMRIRGIVKLLRYKNNFVVDFAFCFYWKKIQWRYNVAKLIEVK